MKNKRAEQIADRKKHRERQKANRRGEPALERSEPHKPQRPTILIVCEGENTEPSYFRQFKLSSATVKPVGEGYNTVSLVNRAVQLASDKQYDQVWCVFDKDDFEANDFNNAIVLAEAHGFRVAYSNQAFEYWIILHFEDHQGGGMNRGDYMGKINGYLKPYGIRYEGDSNKKITEDIFDLLEGIDEKTCKKRVLIAIERARRNYDNFDHSNCAAEESSTKVFELVEELHQYI